MSICFHQISVKLPRFNNPKIGRPSGSKRELTIVSMSSVATDAAKDGVLAANYIPAAPILIPEGPWQQVSGGVTAAKGFKAAGIYGGLRAQGEKPDLALVTCDVDAISAGAFTTNVVAAAPVVYCKKSLEKSKTARAVLINAGQANAATGDAGYQDVIECASSLAEMLHLKQDEILIESTGVIGHRIKKKALLEALPKLVGSLSSAIEGLCSCSNYNY